MSTEADNVINHEEAEKLNEKPARKTEARRKKRTCTREHKDLRLMTKLLGMASNTGMAACGMCHTKLNNIQGKLDKLRSVLPETQNLKIQVATLKKEKEELKESLKSTQAEVEGLKAHLA